MQPVTLPTGGLVLRELAKYINALILLAVLLCPLFSRSLSAQATNTLGGTVTDPSGAVLTGVTVSLTPNQGGQPKTTTTNAQGAYNFRGLDAGTYTITVNVPGFAPYVKQNVEVRAGAPQRIDIGLDIAVEKQEVQVSSDAPRVGISAEENASAVTITQADLDAFSDDPDELQSELMALAGPSVGPNGGQIYVDGFSTDNGLPPKNSIREIRINQNPFSPEYDALGYGRIEIITKPGTNKYHAKFTVDGNDLAFDTRNPLASEEPGYYSFLTTDDVSGPIGKNASFFVDFQHRQIDNNDVVNAVTLDPSFNQIPFSQTIGAPSNLNVVGPRIDYQLTANNSISVSYQFREQDQRNLGVGQFRCLRKGTRYT